MMCKKPNKVFRCIENSYIRPAAEIRPETTTRQCGKVEIDVDELEPRKAELPLKPDTDQDQKSDTAGH